MCLLFSFNPIFVVEILDCRVLFGLCIKCWLCLLFSMNQYKMHSLKLWLNYFLVNFILFTLFKLTWNNHEINNSSNWFDCCKTKSNLNTVWQMHGKSILFRAWIHNNQQLKEKKKERPSEANSTNVCERENETAFMSNE